MLGRGGKATSRTTRDYFNVREDDNDFGVYLDRIPWRFDEDKRNTEECNFTLIPNKEHNREECKLAKEKEIEAWKKFHAFEEVDERYKETISHRWVLVDKSNDPKKPRINARLCARGF